MPVSFRSQMAMRIRVARRRGDRTAARTLDCLRDNMLSAALSAQATANAALAFDDLERKLTATRGHALSCLHPYARRYERAAGHRSARRIPNVLSHGLEPPPFRSGSCE
jgi:hypothetical protein